MPENMRTRIEELLQRAGLSGVPAGPAFAAIVLCALAIAFGVWRWSANSGTSAFSVEESADVAAASAVATRNANPTGGSESPSATVVIHVAGCVRHPGVYTLPSDGRVIDAIEAAGGTLPNAAPDALNLARGLSDGEQIVVLSEDEAATVPMAQATAGGASGGPAGQSGASSPAPGAKVNINTADAQALDSLPGVGPSTAEKIIADRDANGPFSAVEDLGRVSGIGPKKLEQLADLVCVN